MRLWFFLLIFMTACANAPSAIGSRSIAYWNDQADTPDVQYESFCAFADLFEHGEDAGYTLAAAADLNDAHRRVGRDRALVEAGLISRVSYCNLKDTKKKNGIWAGRVLATDIYSKLGFDAAYTHPRLTLLARDPNFFVLGAPAVRRIIIVFPGTEGDSNPYDNLQNLKFVSGYDEPGTRFFKRTKNAYLPRAHTGFRDSASNFFRSGFFEDAMTKSELAQHCETFDFATFKEGIGKGVSPYHKFRISDFICFHDIANGDYDRPVNVVIIGHSLGAGISQVLAASMDGFHWQKSGMDDIEKSWMIKKRDGWPLHLERLYLFAPPLALHSRTKKDDQCDLETNTGVTQEPGNESQKYDVFEVPETAIETLNPIMVYNGLGIIEKTSLVIREGDMVPSLWSPLHGNCVIGQHFGRHFYPINREGKALYRKVPSKDFTNYFLLDQPHTPRNHYAPLIELMNEQMPAKTDGEEVIGAAY